MMYIENIFICISIPLLLSLIFIQGEARKYTLFVCIGMGICVLSAYVSSFFMNYYGVDTIEASIEITPVCEEVMKLFPLLFYILIFEPQRSQIPRVAIAITGMVGLLGACGVFHAIFNLLISADGIWRWMGYLFPSGMIIVLVSVWHLMVKLNHMK